MNQSPEVGRETGSTYLCSPVTVIFRLTGLFTESKNCCTDGVKAGDSWGVGDLLLVSEGVFPRQKEISTQYGSISTVCYSDYSLHKTLQCIILVLVSIFGENSMW